MKILTCIIIMSTLMVNQISAQTETCLQNVNHIDNRIISQIIGTDTINREYILKIPTNYNDNTAAPLIINLHGFGDCATEYSETIEEFYNFSELANEEGIIVAYPQGAYRPEKEDTYWEPGDSKIDNIYENDVYFIEEMVRDIEAQFNINLNKVYACGYSNGGMMAYSLACNRNNLFSAVGIMSGTMLQEDCTIDRPIPIIKFHGIADEVLPYNGSIWYQSVEEVINFWLIQNNIPKSNQISYQLNGDNVILDKYSGGDSNSCLSLYTINEEFDKPGDHVWFSEEIEGLTPNRIMWNFFEGNCSTISSTKNGSQDEIIVYPNPTNQQVKIKNAINQDYRIYDINGRLRLMDRTKSKIETINTANLPSGHYTIVIGSHVGKLVIVK